MNSPISWKQCPGPAVSTTRHCGFLLGRSNDLQDDSFPQSSEIMSWSLATVWQLCQAPQCLLQASTLAWDARHAYFHLWAWLKFLCFLFEVKGTFLWEMILCESVPALLLTHPESISMSCLELQGWGRGSSCQRMELPPPLLCPVPCMARRQPVLGGTPGTDTARPGPRSRRSAAAAKPR